MECINPVSGGTPLSRGTQSLEQKMDTILQEKQQDENAALKSQLKALQEKIEVNCISHKRQGSLLLYQ